MTERDTEDEDGVVHDEVEIEDFEYDPDTDTFKYPCPCGDEFLVTREELENNGKYARCPSCSLKVFVIYSSEDIRSIVETKSAVKNTKSKSSVAKVVG